MLENQFAYGFVIGMLVSSEGDSSDTGKYPDALPINTTITFTRVRGQYKKELSSPENGAKSMLVSHKPVIAGVESNGFITGDIDPIRKIPVPGATPGVWLVEGRYKVNINGLMSEFEIEVTPDNTPESPLDLADWINYSAPPGSTVKVVSIPVGEDGQLMQWYQGEIVWKEPTILQGPPNVLSIGTVESTSEIAYATISGDSPNQVLSLGLPKGDKGDQGVQGPPGAIASPSTYLIVGPGRPDTPTTTSGIITGNEPVGAVYRSTDGASVGAWEWMKRPTGWVVTDGDTGWRLVPVSEWGEINTYVDMAFNNTLHVRRKNDTVEYLHRVKLTQYQHWAKYWVVPSGFRTKPNNPAAGIEIMLGRTNVQWGSSVPSFVILSSHHNAVRHPGGMNSTDDAVSKGVMLSGTWLTDDQWPTTLPGVAA